MKEINGIKLYTLREIAEMLGVTYQAVQKYAKRGLIPATKVGGKYLVTEQSLMKWLNGETAAAAEKPRRTAQDDNTEA